MLNWIILLGLVLLGCKSTPLRESDSAHARAMQPEWVRDYKWAKANQYPEAAKACAIFRRLSEEKDFPPAPLAELRAFETCPAAESPALNRKAFPTWLKETTLDTALTLAQAQGDKVAELELSLEKSRQKLPQRQKLKWVDRALALAKEAQASVAQGKLSATPMATKVSEIQKRRYMISPRLNPNPPPTEFLAVAHDFRMQRKFEQARAYYERIVGGAFFPIDDKIAALKGIRLTYKNERKKEAHIECSLRLVSFLSRAAKKPKASRSLRIAWYEAQTYHARALWTEGRTSDAESLIDNLILALKKRPGISLAELFYLKGRIAEERKDYDSVYHFLDLASKETFKDTELHDKILWYLAWNERRRANLANALTVLKDLEHTTKVDFMKARAIFWQARTYADNSQEKEAKATFARLIELDPMGYYGLLAHQALDIQIALKQASGKSDHMPPIPLDVRLAEWLALIEEKDVLTTLLDQASRDYQAQADQKEEGWVAIFKYYAKAGLYVKLYESLSYLNPEQRKAMLERHTELLFPLPWIDEVKLASTQFGVAEELIYAIMRQESAFDMQARSPADAFGLLQILPEVAERLGHINQIPYSQMEDLFEPKTNIMIGAAHLRELFSRHNNQFIVAVASYNASESVIKNWVRTRFRGDPLEFIEEIPYEETRAYVRLVMRNMIFYSVLKTKSASIDFPNWVLDLSGG